MHETDSDSDRIDFVGLQLFQNIQIKYTVCTGIMRKFAHTTATTNPCHKPVYALTDVKEKPTTASPHAMLKRDEHKNLVNLSTSSNIPATSQLCLLPYEVELHSAVSIK